MLEYGGFRLKQQVGNNAFAYEERKLNPKLWIPELIPAWLEKLSLGAEPVFAELNHQGKLQLFSGLQKFLFFEKNWVPVYVFDNHNHALAFRYREFFKNTLSKGTHLLHLDQHSDMKSNPFSIQQEKWESICSFTQNCCNVGNFILPALNSGLIWEVSQIRSEYALLQSQIPDKDYIFDIDLDFRAPEMGISNFEQTIKKTKNLISSAKMVTIATSPYFLDQKQALELIKLLCSESLTSNMRQK